VPYWTHQGCPGLIRPVTLSHEIGRSNTSDVHGQSIHGLGDDLLAVAYVVVRQVTSGAEYTKKQKAPGPAVTLTQGLRSSEMKYNLSPSEENPQ
jgi:hypothetical protein